MKNLIPYVECPSPLQILNKLTLLSLLIILTIPDVAASSGRPAITEFRRVADENGFPMTDVTSLVCDDYGFIWAGSRMGILRATNSFSTHYDLPVSTSDVMQVKLAYGGGVVAGSTQNGQVFRYNAIADKFEPWFSISHILGNKEWVTNFIVDSDGHAWMSTSCGIFTCSDKNYEQLPGCGRGYSYIVALSGKRMLLISNGAFSRLRTDKHMTRGKGGLFTSYISSSAYDKEEKKVWLGTYKGEVWSYDLKEETLTPHFEKLLPELIVRSIVADESDVLLIALEGGGIALADKKTGKIKGFVKDNIDNPLSLKGNSVYAMLYDPQKRFWAATTSGGVQYAETAQSVIEHTAHLPNDRNSLHNNEVNALMTDDGGHLWVATNDGISRLNISTNEWTHILGGHEMSVLSLTQDNKGDLYAGTYGNGVYRLDSKSGAVLQHFTDSHADIFGNGAFVFAAYTDSEGDIWFGGTKGNIVCYSPSTGKFRKYDPHPVFCFYEISPGTILSGGGDGLISMDKATGQSAWLIGENVIQDIVSDGNTLWLCTDGNGVIELDLNTLKKRGITVHDGLPGNFARSIMKKDSLLLIGTSSGLGSYDLKSRKMIQLPGNDYITRNSFRESATCLLPDGRMAFGTNNGIVAFDPDELTGMDPRGKMFFSDIRVAGHSIRTDKEINLTVPVDSLTELRLKYPRDSFSVSVIPLGNVGSNVMYSWRLEGQDKEWSDLSPLGLISYVNLDPGRYNLQIRMYDGGVVSERAISIVINPPFWQTTWFRLLIVLMIVGVAAAAIRYYIWRMRRKYTFEKVKFYTRMAHDLRSSLMLIKAPLGELKKEKNLSEWGEKCLGIAAEQTDLLTDTATQLLDFEKADIGSEQPNYKKVELIGLIKRRVEAYRNLGASKDITLTEDYQVGESIGKEYIVVADESMIVRIVDNLLSNAVKYSLPGGKVTLKFKGERQNWTFIVKDEGIGIPKSEHRRLFREFYRAENAVNSEIMGTGIGLLAVKRYVDVHGGTVRFESEPGKGTMFEVNMPRRDASVIASGEKSVSNSEEYDKVNEKELVPEDVKDMLILVVEDNTSLREFLVKVLEGRFKVEEASDGEEAWKKMAELQPDLVLTDVMMPKMDGFELCRKIKTTYETSHIPVIILTARDDKDDQMRGLGLGADNYLVKPFDMELLAERISSIIRNRRTTADKLMAGSGVGGNETSETSSDNFGINDEFLQKAVECVKENITNESFGKGEFASAMMISQSLLYKKIKALTDMSVVEFIRSIRLNYAQTLLESGKYNVTEVSEMCGFSSSAYFSRVFKDSYGKNPSELLGKPLQ